MLKIIATKGFNGMKQGVIFTPDSEEEEIRLRETYPTWFEAVEEIVPEEKPTTKSSKNTLHKN
jgi:hypothetical protein